jgi:hypothetical protein
LHSGESVLLAIAELFVTGAAGKTVDRTPFVAVRDGTYCGSGGTPAPTGYRGA